MTYKVMPALLDELYAAGVRGEDITLVFALGSHRKHTDGIGFQSPGAGLRPDHHSVVGLDGVPCGHSRHDGLGPAGISGEIVVLPPGWGRS